MTYTSHNKNHVTILNIVPTVAKKGFFKKEKTLASPHPKERKSNQIDCRRNAFHRMPWDFSDPK